MYKSTTRLIVLMTTILGVAGCALTQTSLVIEGLNVVSIGFEKDSPLAIVVGYRTAPNSDRNIHVVLVDSYTLKLVKSYSLPITIAWDSSPKVSPDGKYFVVRPSDRSNLGVWRVEDGIKVVTLENAGYEGVRWSGSNEVIVGNTVYRMTDGKPVGRVETLIQESYSPGDRPTLSKNQKIEVRISKGTSASSYSTVVQLSDPGSKVAKHNITLTEDPATVHLHFAPDDSLIAVGAYSFSDKGLGGYSSVAVVDTRSGEIVKRLVESTHCHFNTWHPDSTRIFVTCGVYEKGGTQIRVIPAR